MFTWYMEIWLSYCMQYIALSDFYRKSQNIFHIYTCANSGAWCAVLCVLPWAAYTLQQLYLKVWTLVFTCGVHIQCWTLINLGMLKLAVCHLINCFHETGSAETGNDLITLLSSVIKHWTKVNSICCSHQENQLENFVSKLVSYWPTHRGMKC